MGYIQNKGSRLLFKKTKIKMQDKAIVIGVIFYTLKERLLEEVTQMKK